MSHETPDDAPYVMGPGPDYDPPPTDTLTDPAIREHTHTTGRAACIAAIEAATGKTKTDRGWVPREETTEREDR